LPNVFPIHERAGYDTRINGVKIMKVTFFTSPAGFSRLGGAEIQMLKTKEYLNCSEDCSVSFFDIFNDKIGQYDIFHNFTVKLDCLPLYILAKNAGVKLALSPIYWPTPSFTLQNLAKKLVIHLPVFRKWYPIRDFFDLADIVLPNSKMEQELIARRFKIHSRKSCVIPNGVDKVFYKANPRLFIEKYGLEDFVLFVGRIEPRKNVLRLLKVFKTLEMPLVLIGDSLETEYSISCNDLIKSRKNIHYLGFIPHNSALLRSAYAAAKVFVLPSMCETPGLSALEAGLAGCNIVITNNGSPVEYFKDYAWYVNPNSIGDIKTKILEAYSAAKDQKLRERILKNYTWEHVAEETLNAYKRVLAS